MTTASTSTATVPLTASGGVLAPGTVPDEPVYHPYLERIFEVSARYLNRSFTSEQLGRLMSRCYTEIEGDRRETIDGFLRVYYDFVKRRI